MIAKAKGNYKRRDTNTVEMNEKFLSNYPKVVNYLNKKTPPTIIEIAKFTDCSKNTVQKIKKYYINR